MAALDVSAIPLLPLSSGVVLPGMVVALALETPEAIAAVGAAESADGQLVLVPRISVPASPGDRSDEPSDGAHSAGLGRFARVGTVAKVDGSGRLPGGVRAVVVRGLHRAYIG